MRKPNMWPDKNGDIILNYVVDVDDKICPEEISGSIVAGWIISASGLVLPRIVGDCVFLERLQTAKGIVLPEKIGDSLWINDLKNIEDLILPKVGRWIFGEFVLYKQNAFYVNSVSQGPHPTGSRYGWGLCPAVLWTSSTSETRVTKIGRPSGLTVVRR
jgi:hypothetical protein